MQVQNRREPMNSSTTYKGMRRVMVGISMAALPALALTEGGIAW